MSTDIVRLDGRRAPLDSTLVSGLGQALRGELLSASDDGYDDARGLHNGMIDKRPALIARCTGTADVITAVNFARDHGLLISVRGGGHGVAGHAVQDGVLMIDLSLMNSVRVDPEARVAWVGGGALLGDVDHETQAFGLVAPAGVVSTTGVAGLTLGGGYGWVRGKYGMSVDNLLAVDIVTADGQLCGASAEQNTDLFWAVRGGGGNFGIVTTFEFRLHPLGPILMHCAPMYRGVQAREVLEAWRAFMQDAPDEFTTEFFFWTIPEHPTFPSEVHGEHVVIPAGVYAGEAEEGERFVQPLREIGAPLLDLSAQRPFVQVQQMFDPFVPKGLLNYWKCLYLDRLDDEILDRVITVFEERPAVRCPFVLHDLRGASGRVPVGSMAFAGRERGYLFELNSSWTDPAATDRNIAWTRAAWRDLSERYSSGGGYLNMNSYSEGGAEWVETTFGPNYERLQRIKKQYDPMNLFRLNANIPPA